MRGKDVIFDKAFPLTFADAMLHKDVEYRGTPTSAGFFRVYADEDGRIDIAVYGRSESLGLSSQPEDAATIKAFMGMGPLQRAADALGAGV